jgi:tetratricopeptide (TPR) repeat protein
MEGKGLLGLRRQADALPLLKQAVKLSSELYDGAGSPSLADAHATLAECLYELGDHANAQLQFAQAKAIVGAQKQLGEHIRRPIAERERRITHTR